MGRARFSLSPGSSGGGGCRAPGVLCSYCTVSSERLWRASLRRWTVSCPPVRYLPQPWLAFGAGAVLGWLASHSLHGRTTASAWCRVRQAPHGVWNAAAWAQHVADRVLLSERLLLTVKQRDRSDGPNGACYPGLK